MPGIDAHFRMWARHNAWANARLYAACAALTDAERRRNLGAAFGGIARTLNHVLVADVIWTARIRGAPDPPWAPDHVAHDDFDDLRAARAAMDEDIARLCAAPLPAAAAGRPTAEVLAHMFNHQTHHRGQCHAMLTRLRGEAPALDLIVFNERTC